MPNINQQNRRGVRRLPTRQKSKFVVVSATVPRKIYELLRTECSIYDHSISAMIGDKILTERYKRALSLR